MGNINDIGITGVLGYKTVLGNIGENIANANSEYYSRKTVDLTQNVGHSGVSIGSVIRSADVVLTRALRDAVANEENAGVYAEKISYLENRLYVDDVSISSYLTRFFDSIDSLTNAPDDTGIKEVFLQRAYQVADKFYEAVTFLEDERDDSFIHMQENISNFNRVGKALAGVNSSIRQLGNKIGQKASLLDERDRLLEYMSSIAKVDVKENKDGTVNVGWGAHTKANTIVTAGGEYKTVTVEKSDKGVSFATFNGDIKHRLPVDNISGKSAGMLSYYNLLQSIETNLDTFVISFTQMMNNVHHSGITQDGRRGEDIFSVDMVDIESQSTLNDDSSIKVTVYDLSKIVSYDMSIKVEQDGQFTLMSAQGKQLVTGSSRDLEKYGISVEVNNSTSVGDNFVFSIDRSAAKSVKVMLSSPSQVATGSPVSIIGDTNNTTETDMSVVEDIPAHEYENINKILSSVQDLFSGNMAVSSAHDPTSAGAIAYIPAGTSDMKLRSYDTSDIGSLYLNINQLHSMEKINLTLEGGKNIEIDVSDYPKAKGFTAFTEALYNEKALAEEGISVFMSSGAINFSVPGVNIIESLSYDSKLQNGSVESTPGVLFEGTESTRIRIFSRDGVQLSGPALSEDEIQAMINPENGFLPGALYIPQEEAAGRAQGLGIQTAEYESGKQYEADITDNGSHQTASMNITWADVNAPRITNDSYRDGWSGRIVDFTVVTPDGVQMDGTLPSDKVSSVRAKDVANALQNQLDDMGVRATMHFPMDVVDFAGKEAVFELEYAGRKFEVNLKGATDATNGLEDIGVSVKAADGGKSPLTAFMTESGLVVGTTRQLSSHDLKITKYPDDATMSSLKIVNVEHALQGIAKDTVPLSSSFKVSVGQDTVTISSDEHGMLESSNEDLVQIVQKNMPDGTVRFSLQSSVDNADLRINDDTSESVKGAATFGFYVARGTSVNVTGGTQLELSMSAGGTSEATEGENVDENSSSFRLLLTQRSSVGHEVHLSGYASEDLIVMTGETGGRGIAASWGDINLNMSELDKGEIQASISEDGEFVEFSDEYGILARRKLSDIDTSYHVGDTSYEFNGHLAAGDAFTIKHGHYFSNDNRNILKLSAVQHASMRGVYNNISFNDYLVTEMTNMGSRVQIAKINDTAAFHARSEVESLLEAKIGVNLDEEAANMLHYQQAYEASARILAVSQEMFQSLLSFL